MSTNSAKLQPLTVESSVQDPQDADEHCRKGEKRFD